jgi:two-component system chemotaxis response regulator CheB
LRHDIIGIGGSFGAIDVLKRVLGDLPATLPASIFVTLHTGARGLNLLADVFQPVTSLSVSTAVEGEPVQRGHIYIAPADRHLLVIDQIIRLGRGPRENMSRPAIDPLFRSLATTYGPRVIAVVLTGYLDDGAAGLADVQRCGGLTVIQSPQDAEAPSMPLGALRSTDVEYRAGKDDLGRLLTSLVEEPASGARAIPPDIALEVDIALGRPADTDRIARIAQPVALSCPTCSGVLSQIERPPLRFRCQVGHGFSAETLSDAQTRGADEAIHVALRIIEERKLLMGKMAQDARSVGRESMAHDFDRRGAEYQENIEHLRAVAAQTLPENELDVDVPYKDSAESDNAQSTAA